MTDKFKELVALYKNTHIEFEHLKGITLAQWILESGRGESELAKQHLNFAGLNWRPEMEGFAEPVSYVASDGVNIFCKFSSLEKFIAGFWHFIDRTPYTGWREHVASASDFLSFIVARGYCPTTGYVQAVLDLLSEADALLAKAPKLEPAVPPAKGWFQLLLEIFIAWIKTLFESPAVPGPVPPNTPVTPVNPTPPVVVAPEYFCEWILKAVDKLKPYYGLGYDYEAYTHPLAWNGQAGVFNPTKRPYTMCVAATKEVALTAFDDYYQSTLDKTVYSFLSLQSWTGWTVNDIHAWWWVALAGIPDARGAASAIDHFGLGKKCKFEELLPGGFINFHFSNGYGHSVIFINYIDKNGAALAKYGANVVGFKFFSSQGSLGSLPGGLGYRNVIFDNYKGAIGNNPATYQTLRAVWSTNDRLLTCGMMWHPSRWKKTAALSARVFDIADVPGPAAHYAWTDEHVS